MVPKPPLRQSSAGEIQKGLGKHGKIVDDMSPLYQRTAQSARAGGRKMAGISRYEKAALGLTAAFLLFTGGWFYARQSAAQPYTVTVSQSAPEELSLIHIYAGIADNISHWKYTSLRI